MQPNHAEVQDGVAIYLRNSLGTQAGLEGSLLISLASVLQRLLPEWLSQKLFRCPSDDTILLTGSLMCRC